MMRNMLVVTIDKVGPLAGQKIAEKRVELPLSEAVSQAVITATTVVMGSLKMKLLARPIRVVGSVRGDSMAPENDLKAVVAVDTGVGYGLKACCETVMELLLQWLGGQRLTDKELETSRSGNGAKGVKLRNGTKIFENR